ITLKQGANRLKFNSNDTWSDIRIDFKKNSDIVINIDSIVFSRHALAPSNALYIFLGLFVVFGFLLYFFFYHKLWDYLKVPPLLLLAVIIILQIGQILYYAEQRKTLFVDETWEILFANANLNSYWELSTNKWQDSQYFKDIYSISDNNRFKFGKVYKDMANANPYSGRDRPPLYHFLLNATWSIFGGTFNNWVGIFLNIFIFIFASIILYLSSKSIFKNNLALLPNLLWGFSAGAVSLFYYVRFYALECFFCILLFYLICRIADNKNLNIKFYILLALTICFGFLTQYFFIVWVACISIIIFPYLIVIKRYETIKKGCIAVCSGLGLSLLIWKYSIRDMFGSFMGQAVRSNALNMKDLLDRYSVVYRSMERSLFDHELSFVFLLILVILIIFLVKKLRKNISVDNGTIHFAININIKPHIPIYINQYRLKIIIVLTSILYIAIVYKSVLLYYEPRYGFPIYPILIIAFIVIFNSICNRLFKGCVINKKSFVSAIVIIMVLFGFVNKHNRLTFFSPHFTFDYNAFLEIYKDTHAIVVGITSFTLIDIVDNLANHEKSFILFAFNKEDIEKQLLILLSDLDRSHETIVYVQKSPMDEPFYLSVMKIIQDIGFNPPKLLLKNRHYNVYRIS
ncbi:MAG: glycosyltransferase family 39 protein, partial [Endomicrobium sp.]|nr:glycosyltransferase family 39 protein [Endomicrobium sp.]